MRPAIHLIVIAAVGCVACSRDGGNSRNDSASPATSREASFALAECYRSPASVMARTTPLTGRPGVAPGWLRFAPAPTAAGGVGPSSPDSGLAQLIDADGAEFQAQWRRVSTDSVEIRGFNDFMQITLRAAVADSALQGFGLVTSDADVQRDSAGRLEPLRREWRLTARAASCDSVPAVAR